MTVYDLYQLFNLSNDNLDACAKSCFHDGKESYFKYLYYSKISDLYISYLQSKRYKRLLKKVCKSYIKKIYSKFYKEYIYRI